MKKIIAFTIIFIFMFTAVYPIKGLEENDKLGKFDNYDFTSVDVFLQDAVDSIPLEGCVLLLIKDGKVIYERAFGSYNIDTVVPIASASKWVSAVLIMKLVDEGLLSLDDKISKWIPSFDNRDDKKDITIRQCFSHTSGLPSSALCVTHQEPPWTIEICANIIAKRILRESPGTAFRYGSIAMQVAGRVAELAGVDTWINLYKDKISEPLGITSLVWNNDYPNTENPWLAGGITQITVNDYAKLLQMILNGGVYNNVTIMSQETVKEMLKDQTNGVPVASSPYERSIDHPHLGYGIGAWIDVTNENNEVVEMSSTGAFGFHPWIDLNNRMVGVFLVKTSLRKVSDIEVELRLLIRDIVSENKAPNIPDIPVGPTKIKPGISYTYNVVTTDPENENISYLFDWGDGTNSQWTSYEQSGKYISATHVWKKIGTYNIKVKAKDSNGTESRWSNPLPINIPRNRAIYSFYWLNYLERFPLLNKLIYPLK